MTRSKVCFIDEACECVRASPTFTRCLDKRVPAARDMRVRFSGCCCLVRLCKEEAKGMRGGLALFVTRIEVA